MRKHLSIVLVQLAWLLYSCAGNEKPRSEKIEENPFYGEEFPFSFCKNFKDTCASQDCLEFKFAGASIENCKNDRARGNFYIIIKNKSPDKNACFQLSCINGGCVTMIFPPWNSREFVVILAGESIILFPEWRTETEWAIFEKNPPARKSIRLYYQFYTIPGGSRSLKISPEEINVCYCEEDGSNIPCKRLEAVRQNKKWIVPDIDSLKIHNVTVYPRKNYLEEIKTPSAAIEYRILLENKHTKPLRLKNVVCKDSSIQCNLIPFTENNKLIKTVWIPEESNYLLEFKCNLSAVDLWTYLYTEKHWDIDLEFENMQHGVEKIPCRITFKPEDYSDFFKLCFPLQMNTWF